MGGMRYTDRGPEEMVCLRFHGTLHNLQGQLPSCRLPLAQSRRYVLTSGRQTTKCRKRIVMA